MAGTEMQACFFCREWISARAEHCPYCGESLTFPSRAEILDVNLDQATRDAMLQQLNAERERRPCCWAIRT